jgi:hypothetical protein
MVGVQVLPDGHCALLPTVQMVLVVLAGVEMHWPPQGTLGVELMVGVQVLPGGQGRSLPTVQGMTGGRVGAVVQTPRQGTVQASVGVQEVVQGSTGVQNQDVGQGALLPGVQGMVGSGDCEGVVIVGTWSARHSPRTSVRRRRDSMMVF